MDQPTTCQHPASRQVTTAEGQFCLDCGAQTGDQKLAPATIKPRFGLVHDITNPPQTSDSVKPDARVQAVPDQQTSSLIHNHPGVKRVEAEPISDEPVV